MQDITFMVEAKTGARENEEFISSATRMNKIEGFVEQCYLTGILKAGCN